MLSTLHISPARKKKQNIQTSELKKFFQQNNANLISSFLVEVDVAIHDIEELIEKYRNMFTLRVATNVQVQVRKPEYSPYF